MRVSYSQELSYTAAQKLAYAALQDWEVSAYNY